MSVLTARGAIFCAAHPQEKTPTRENTRRSGMNVQTSVPFYMDGSLRPAFDLQP
jgi:hypothetical protein